MQFKKLFIIILFFYSAQLKASELVDSLKFAETFYNNGIDLGRNGLPDSALHNTQKAVQIFETAKAKDTVIFYIISSILYQFNFRKNDQPNGH